MKKTIAFLLSMLLIFSFAACGSKESTETPVETPQENSEQQEPESSEENSTESETSSNWDIKEDPIYIADAALYRGSLIEFEIISNEISAKLEQYPGSSYGAKNINIIINSDTALSFDPTEMKTGDYIEVFYGGPIEAGIDEALSVIGANNLGNADSRVYNGTVQSVSADPESSNEYSITMSGLEDDGEIVFNVNTDQGTQIYMNADKLVEGAKLNIFHDVAMTASMPPQVFALEIRIYDEGEENAETAAEQPAEETTKETVE